MARPGITYEQVAAAADALKAQGQNATIDAVRAQLGTGSKSTIHRYLRQWEDSRPTVAAAPVEMPNAIHAAIVEEIRRAVAETRAAFEQKLAEARATADELAQLNEDLETANDGLAEKLAQEQADNQQLVGQLDAMNREIEQIKKDAAAQVAEIRDQAAAQIAEARADAQREREAAESARQSLARAELRLEAVPALEKQLEALRVQLDAERSARTAAEKAAAVAVAERDQVQAALARVEQRLEALPTLETKLEALRAQLDAERNARSDAEKASAGAVAERDQVKAALARAEQHEAEARAELKDERAARVVAEKAAATAAAAVKAKPAGTGKKTADQGAES